MTTKPPARQRVKIVLRFVLSAILVFTGISHLVHPESFLKIMPPMIPLPYFFVIFTGLCELAAAAGLQGDLFTKSPRLRRLTAWLLVVFLLAIFPANFYMALHPEISESLIGGPTAFGMSAQTIGWLRLPLQVPLILWAWWYT